MTMIALTAQNLPSHAAAALAAVTLRGPAA
jgi:hypothetical protein